jgi:hypothetical protein
MIIAFITAILAQYFYLGFYEIVVWPVAIAAIIGISKITNKEKVGH